MSNHKFQIHFKTCFVMENTSLTAFLGESLLVVVASVFPQICQAVFAEINYLSSSVHKSPGSCVVSEPVAQQLHAGCLVVLVSWTISWWPGEPGLACMRGGRSLQEEVPGVLRGRK